jgi:hypothetical protein
VSGIEELGWACWKHVVPHGSARRRVSDLSASEIESDPELWDAVALSCARSLNRFYYASTVI